MKQTLNLINLCIYISNLSSVNFIDITQLLTNYLRNHNHFLLWWRISLDWMSFNGAHNALILLFLLVQIFGQDVEALKLRLAAHHVHAYCTCRCLMGFLSGVLWTLWNHDVIAYNGIIRFKLLPIFIIQLNRWIFRFQSIFFWFFILL